MMIAMVMLYVGPDQLMPLASVLGAIGGAIMIFWRQVKAFWSRMVATFRKN